MKKVIVKKALDALKKQALKDQDLKNIKGGGRSNSEDPPYVSGQVLA